MAILEVKCPMCKGSLWIEQSTGRVVDHKTAEQQKVSLDLFLQEQKSKSSKWDDKIVKAKDDVAKRKAEIEERFKSAKEKPEDLPDDYESPFKWD
jgi:hypothetical protein